MTKEIVKSSPATLSIGSGGPIVPAVIAQASDHAAKCFLEFFAATIRNHNTRRAYARAVCDFFAWCETHQIALLDIEPLHVAAYVEPCQLSMRDLLLNDTNDAQYRSGRDQQAGQRPGVHEARSWNNGFCGDRQNSAQLRRGPRSNK